MVAKPCRSSVRARWLSLQQSRIAGESIIADAADAVAANGPELVAKVLFDERDFSLDSDFNIGQRGFLAEVRRNAGEDPTGAFLIHEAAGAVDWVDDDAPAGIVLVGASRQCHPTVRQAFADQDDGLVGRNFAREAIDKGGFADPIDCVDDVAGAFVGDASEFIGRALFARHYDQAADRVVQAAERFDEVGGCGHKLASGVVAL